MNFLIWPVVGLLGTLAIFPEASSGPVTLHATDGSIIRFIYEVVLPPDDAIVANPAFALRHPNGCQYVVDGYDQTIKVFGPQDEFLYSFGGRGQGPGEWSHIGTMSIGPDGDIYVWDELRQALHEFTPDGKFVRQIRQEDRIGRGDWSIRAPSWMCLITLRACT